MTAPIALAVFLLATQHPVSPYGDGALTSEQHDPEPGLANRDAVQMLTTGKVKFELVDSNGVEHKASLVRIDGNNAVLRSQGGIFTIPVGQLQRIERRGDRRWDGALIGFGVGFGALAFTVARAPLASVALLAGSYSATSEARVNVALIALLCVPTAIGYVIDAHHVTKRTVFVGSMTAAAVRPPALTLAVSGPPHERKLNVGYRMTF